MPSLTDRVVLRFLSRRASINDGEYLETREKQLWGDTFADSNGALFMKILEIPPDWEGGVRPSYDKSNGKTYLLVATMSHFGAWTEMRIPLLELRMVDFLIEALQKARPLVAAGYQSYLPLRGLRVQACPSRALLR